MSEFVPTREAIYRAPFIIRMERNVFVSESIKVHLCPETNNRDLCLLRAVAALTEYVQSETKYVTDSYYAKVDMEIQTKVMYPYMLISGQGDSNTRECKIF